MAMPDHEHDEHWHDRMDVQSIDEHLRREHGWFPEEGQTVDVNVVKREHLRRHAGDPGQRRRAIQAHLAEQEGVSRALGVLVGPVDSGGHGSVQAELRRIQVAVRGQMDGIRPIEAVVLTYRWVAEHPHWVFEELQPLVQGLDGALKPGTVLTSEDFSLLGPSLGWAWDMVTAMRPRG
jgi:hypothetical protein